MKSQKYFDAHPKVNKFYFTTDGLAFTNENAARNHQKSKNGKPGDIETVKRGDKKANENAGAIEKLEAEIKDFQELLLDTTNVKDKAGIEENIKKLKDEIIKLK